MPDAPRSSVVRGRHPADVLTAVVVASVMAAQVVFHVRDLRLPTDPGLYHFALPHLWRDLGHPFTQASTLLGTLLHSTGWYNLLLALVMRVAGRHEAVLEIACLGWTLLLIGCSALAARRLGGPLAGLCTTLLVAGMPMVIAMGRSLWIHIPETALVLLVLVAWMGDPLLERRRTQLTVAVGGALAVTLRASALAWIGTFLPLMLIGSRRSDVRRRWAMIAVTWALATSIPAMEFRFYVLQKIEARDRYVSDLPDLWRQVAANLSAFALAAVLIGFVALLPRRLTRPREPVPLVLGAWVVVGFGLWLVFRSGINNFTPMAPALAILGGLGLARLGPSGAVLAAVAFSAYFAPQWIPPSWLGHWVNHPLAPQDIGPPGILNQYRPWRGFSDREVGGLLAATCPPPEEATCTVLVDQGLFRPYAEDAGYLELFLMRLDNVDLKPLRNQKNLLGIPILHAVATLDCMRDVEWRHRFPEAQELFRQLATEYDLQRVWSHEVQHRCTYVWMAPQGRVARPDLLPVVPR